MPPLTGRPSFITEPKSWDVDALDYGALELSTDTLNVSMAGVATQVTLAALLTELTLKADLTDTQPVSMAAVPVGSIALVDIFKTRQDTFTAAANGVTVNTATSPLRGFAIQVKGTGAAATTWDIRLEGSLDGTNFAQILAHTNATGDGAIVWTGAVLSPSLYFRSRTSGLVLGPATNVVVTILGLSG